MLDCRLMEDKTTIKFYNTGLPIETTLYILSFLDPYTAFRIRHVSRPLLEWSLSCSQLSAFHSVCLAIESDKNYRAACTNAELISWSYLESNLFGTISIHSAFSITSSDLTRSVGKLYSIKSTMYDSDNGLFSVYDKKHCIVNFNGHHEICLFSPESNKWICADSPKLNLLLKQPSCEEQSKNKTGYAVEF